MKCLILCQSYTELKKIRYKYAEIGKINRSDIILVSSNPEIYRDSHIIEDGFIVIPMDSDKSIFDVDKAVIKIINQINAKFNTGDKKKDLKQYLYTISYQIETGGVQNVILETLCWIDFFLNIFERYKIEEVIYFENRDDNLVKRILVLLAQHNGLNITVRNKNIWKIKQTFSFKHDGTMSHNRYCFLKRVSIIFKMVRYILKCKYNRSENSEFGVLCCSDAIKHINWLLPMLEGLSQRGSCRIICMHASYAAQKYNEYGYIADEIEEYLTVRSFIKSLGEYFAKYKEIQRELLHFEISYRGLFDIFEILKPAINEHLKIQVFQGYILDACCKNYFRLNNFDFVKEWGNANFLETQICYHNSLGSKKRPVFFQVNGLYSFNVHMKELPIKDCVFVNNRKDYMDLSSMGYTNRCYFLINSPQLIKRYVETKTLYYSCRESGGFNILFAPSFPSTGRNSCIDYTQGVLRLILLCEKKSGLELTIKSHPNLSNINEEFLRKQVKGKHNVSLGEKNQAIEPYLKGCDVVVTSTSAVILDAMVSRKPVICMVSDIDKKCIEGFDGITVCENIDDLCNILNRLCSESEFRENWINNSVKRQNEFFENFFWNKKLLVEPSQDIVNYLYYIKREGEKNGCL